MHISFCKKEKKSPLAKYFYGSKRYGSTSKWSVDKPVGGFMAGGSTSLKAMRSHSQQPSGRMNPLVFFLLQKNFFLKKG